MRKVFDCFTFFNELDLLEIRLNILNDVVDRFVLVESTKNFQGRTKPLFYEQNKSLYKDFSHKIIHVIVDEFPDNPTNSAWIMEYHQRNSILKGLENADKDDIILISDVDEIPDPKKVKDLQLNNEIIIFRQKMFYYYFNCINATGNYAWNATIATRFGSLGFPQDLREMSMRMMQLFHTDFKRRWYYRLRKLAGIDHKGVDVSFIQDAGWHFSYLGGVLKIIEKLEAFAHSEYNKPEYKDPQRIEEAIKKGEDIFGRGFRYRFVEIDSSFPEYIRKNLDKYKQYVFSS